VIREPIQENALWLSISMKTHTRISDSPVAQFFSTTQVEKLRLGEVEVASYVRGRIQLLIPTNRQI